MTICNYYTPEARQIKGKTPKYPCVLTEAFKQATIPQDTLLLKRKTSGFFENSCHHFVTTEDADFTSIEPKNMLNFGLILEFLKKYRAY
jgi:hypothetical protein